MRTPQRTHSKPRPRADTTPRVGKPTAIRIGTAGWSLPRASAPAFPAAGTHLERYASVFNAVEITSSFYRPHRRETYAKWAASVPDDFRFSVKAPREITHELRLRACSKPLRTFLDEIDALGSRLGCLLIQLPPSLAFERRRATSFFTLLRREFERAVALEPRHASWFEPAVEELLRQFDVGRVGADPSLSAAAAAPMTGTLLSYHRLHGSPRMYYSNYEEPALVALSHDLVAAAARGREAWCIFDNTAHGFAIANALRAVELVSRSSKSAPRTVRRR
ncbi:MAG TPA: DUF72 domain-containing protein [Rhodanobacteraceae bacterium]